MPNPKVSIIIPTYNGADYLGETIQSVLDQTYPYWELILVDDCSLDHTEDVIMQFADPRIRFIRHEHNRGSDVARNTGLLASIGEIIAFLDQDDLFHPEKLKEHLAFLEENPEIGLTYNARFELNYSARTIRDIWRPPTNIRLEDLVLWFPIAPSDAVVRRKWAKQMDLIGGRRGAEFAHFGRLFLDGCKFGYLDRALNYRRYHSSRVIKDLAAACLSEINNQVKVFTDPRCPAEVSALRPIAHANLYMYWSYLAFAQGETELGRQFIGEAIRLKPGILRGFPCELVNLLIINSIDDENIDHKALLERIFTQLSTEVPQILGQMQWAVGRGFLLKAARNLMWGRPDDGHRYYAQAIEIGAQVDESYLHYLTKLLVDYEAEFGEASAERVLLSWNPYLERLGGQIFIRKLRGSYGIGRAFQIYQEGEYRQVPKTVVRAIINDPKYSTNRGVQAIFFRSIIGLKPG